MKAQAVQKELPWLVDLSPEGKIAFYERQLEWLCRCVEELDQQKTPPEREELDKAHRALEDASQRVLGLQEDLDKRNEEITELKAELQEIKEGTRIPQLEKTIQYWRDQYQSELHGRSLAYEQIGNARRLEYLIDQAWRLLEDRVEPTEETLALIARSRDGWLERCAKLRLKDNKCHCDTCMAEREQASSLLAEVHRQDLIYLERKEKEKPAPPPRCELWEELKQRMTEQFGDRCYGDL